MDRYDELLMLAKNDLKVARIILNSANDELMHNSAAYNAQQAVEKIMKALIVQAGGHAGISHNITELSKDLDELEVTYPGWINDVDYDVSSWATTIRYNINFKADYDLIETVINNTETWIKVIESE